MILSSQSIGPVSDILGVFEQELSIDSWVSNRLQGRALRCPNCRRVVITDPLVRSEVMFADWDDSSGQNAPPIVFYV